MWAGGKILTPKRPLYMETIVNVALKRPGPFSPRCFHIKFRKFKKRISEKRFPNAPISDQNQSVYNWFSTVTISGLNKVTTFRAPIFHVTIFHIKFMKVYLEGLFKLDRIKSQIRLAVDQNEKSFESLHLAISFRFYSNLLVHHNSSIVDGP